MAITQNDIWDLLDKEVEAMRKQPGEITAPEYAKKFHVSLNAARKKLGRLCLANKLERRKASGNVSYYRVKK